MSPAAEPQVEVILDGLNNPFALAAQPRTDNLFVANSGAGEVLLVDSAKKTSQPVVTGAPTVLGGPGGAYRVGPLGLACNTPTSLLVAGPSAAGACPVRSFPVTKEPVAAPWHEAGEVAAEGITSQAWRLVPAADGALVAMVGKDAGAIEQWPLRKAAKAERFISPTALGGGQGVWALAMSPRADLVVASAGKVEKARDSRVFFCGGRSGKTLLSAALELRDVIDLAYSPKTGRLYAVDFSAAAPAEGGVFRLDAGPDGQVKAVRVATLERPTALAINADGKLFATQLLTAPDAEGRAAGRLVKLSGVW
jgi:glucose/arabinose dehydrogenase